MSRAILDMYAFDWLQAANQALWDRIRAGVPDAPETLTDAPANLDHIAHDVMFAQTCGYPLFRGLRGQAVMLGVPRYDFEGCDGPTHRAAFIVRADDPARNLAAMRGKVFGYNSDHSNTGMNLPRLSVARVADRAAFFRRVNRTGSHHESLRQLARGLIDLCSVDCVTWGLLQQHGTAATAGLRVLEWTEPSPCLPFVTSVATPDPVAAGLAANLLGQTEPGLGLVGVDPPDPAAYALLADYEREAVARDYPVLA